MKNKCPLRWERGVTLRGANATANKSGKARNALGITPSKRKPKHRLNPDLISRDLTMASPKKAPPGKESQKTALVAMDVHADPAQQRGPVKKRRGRAGPVRNKPAKKVRREKQDIYQREAPPSEIGRVDAICPTAGKFAVSKQTRQTSCWKKPTGKKKLQQRRLDSQLAEDEEGESNAFDGGDGNSKSLPTPRQVLMRTFGKSKNLLEVLKEGSEEDNATKADRDAYHALKAVVQENALITLLDDSHPLSGGMFRFNYGNLLYPDNDKDLTSIPTRFWDRKENVRASTKNVILYILRRPDRVCLNPTAVTGWGHGDCRQCSCLYELSTAVKKYFPDAKENPESLPPIVWEYFERITRFVIGIRFLREKKYKLDDLSRFLLSNAVLCHTIFPAPNPGDYMIAFLVHSVCGKLVPFTGKPLCGGSWSELVGCRCGTSTLCRTIRDSSVGALLKFWKNTFQDASLATTEQLQEKHWDHRTTLSRKSAFSGKGHGKALMRQMHFRHNVSKTNLCKLVYQALNETRVMYNVIDTHPEPQIGLVWAVFQAQYGCLVPKHRFKTLYNEVVGATSFPTVGDDTLKDTSILPGYQPYIVMSSRAYRSAKRMGCVAGKDFNYEVLQFSTPNESETLGWEEETLEPYIKDCVWMDPEAAGNLEVAREMQKVAAQRLRVSRWQADQIESAREGFLNGVHNLKASTSLHSGPMGCDPIVNVPECNSLLREGVRNLVFPLRGRTAWKNDEATLQRNADFCVYDTPKKLDVASIGSVVQEKFGLSVKTAFDGGMRRCNGNDNLFEVPNSFSLQSLMSEYGGLQGDDLEESAADVEKEIIRACTKSMHLTEDKFKEQYGKDPIIRLRIKATIPDMTKRSIEGCRLKFPVEEIIAGHRDKKLAACGVVPLHNAGHLGLYRIGIFDETEEADETGAPDFACQGVLGQLMPHSMAVYSHAVFVSNGMTPTTMPNFFIEFDVYGSKTTHTDPSEEYEQKRNSLAAFYVPRKGFVTEQNFSEDTIKIWKSALDEAQHKSCATTNKLYETGKCYPTVTLLVPMARQNTSSCNEEMKLLIPKLLQGCLGQNVLHGQVDNTEGRNIEGYRIYQKQQTLCDQPDSDFQEDNQRERESSQSSWEKQSMLHRAIFSVPGSGFGHRELQRRRCRFFRQ